MPQFNLVLLIGSNPLPNLVAAIALKEQVSKYWLLHSEGTYSTKQYSENLKKAIQEKISESENQIEIKSLSNISSSRSIESDLQNLNIDTNEHVYLNYTGGTKAMAVHTYRYLEKRFNDNFSASYLDARNFEIVFDYGANENINQLREKVHLSVQDILAIHNYKILSYKEELEGQQIINYISDIISSLQENPSIDIPNNITDKFPIQSDIDKNDVEGGKWLEKLIFLKLEEWNKRQSSDKISIGHTLYAQNDNNRLFELDAFVLFGYQLIAISITKSKDKDKVKKRAFEVYHRAKQIGGDEAKAILIVGWKNNEIEESSGAKKVQILTQDIQSFTGTSAGEIIVIGQEGWLNIVNVLDQITQK